MARSWASLSSVVLFIVTTSAAPFKRLSTDLPSVQLDNGTFFGTVVGETNAYLGIKFADAPRFALPVPVGPYNGVNIVDAFGPACPQQNLFSLFPVSSSSIVGDPFYVPIQADSEEPLPPSEDCLSLNVWVPTGTGTTGQLPVIAWIYGGAFEVGEADGYDGSVIVTRSLALQEPVIYVSMNYRVSAYGFLASQEVKDAGVGNIGLEDQRAALRWIQKYIHAFGGDPTHVTIWGQSAGAISVSLHMLTNGGNTEGLFNGAFMQSGAPIPVGDITNGQPDYDALVNNTSCGGEQDTLACLRSVSFEVLQTAVDKSPSLVSHQALRLTWLPRTDGRFLVDHPQNLVLNGSVANIPYVTGNCDDESTGFSIYQSLDLDPQVVVNDADFREYLLSNYITGATESDVGNLFDTLYPDDPTQGSPFGTGDMYNYRQFKRLAAIQGDLVFQAPRRFFLENTYDSQPTWSFLSKRMKSQEFLGSSHGTDMDSFYGPGDMTDYLIHFVNHGDPNGAGDNLIEWPVYDIQSRHQLTLTDDPDLPLVITDDVYRKEGFDKLTELSLKFPI